MHHLHNLFIPLYVLIFILNRLAFCSGNLANMHILNVGEELLRETLPLKMGSRLYQLQGLKPYSWYEVKISYPASIPASFNLQLKKDDSELALNHNRRLLNTEKLIFRTENLNSPGDQDQMFVLVSVEPEGVVAIPNVQEREFIIFNIVCDELFLGIPYKVWAVVALALICLALAFIVPSFLPPWLLETSRRQRLGDQIVASKDS